MKYFKNIILKILFLGLISYSLSYSLEMSVKDSAFGAKGDGVTDDRLAIQKAIDSVFKAGGGTVNFPAGVYLITAPNKNVWQGQIVIRSNIKLQGVGKDKSIIKMANNQGVWDCMIWDQNRPVTNFSMFDLGMNGNGATNQNMTPVSSSTPGQLHTQIMCHGVLRNSLFKRCHFYNNSGVWCIFIPNGLSNVTVDSCVFDTIGGFTAMDYDHSSIYTTGNGPVMVSNNTFTTRYGPGTRGVWAAIEIHGSNQKVVNNKISGYYTAINVVAGGSINPARNQQYIGNKITGVTSAFVFWSRVDSTLFMDNDISLNCKDWNWLFDGKTRSAFQFNPVAGSEPITSMKIINNRITHTDAGQSNYLDAGISLNTVWFSGPTPVFNDLTIYGNKITSSISAGILIMGNVNKGDISNDTIVNPGSAVGAAEFKSGIYLSGSFTNVHANSNVVIDNLGVHRIAFGIYERTNNLGGCTQCKNTVSIADKAGISPFYQAPTHGGATWGTQCIVSILPQIKTASNFPEMQIFKTSELLRAYLSSAGIKTVTLTDIQGKRLVQELVDGEGWFETSVNKMVAGLNILTVKSQEGKISRRILNF